MASANKSEGRSSLLSAKLIAFRAIPKKILVLVDGSLGHESWLKQQLFSRIEAKIEKLTSENPEAQPTALLEHFRTLGIAVSRVVGLRKNKWGKWEIQTAEMLQLLTHHKAKEDEIEKFSWTGLPLGGEDDELLTFLNQKLAKNDHLSALAEPLHFLVSIYDVVASTKPFNGKLPLFPSFQVVQLMTQLAKKRKAAGDEITPPDTPVSDLNAAAPPPPAKKAKKSKKAQPTAADMIERDGADLDAAFDALLPIGKAIGNN